jgi:hypothetical protein
MSSNRSNISAFLFCQLISPFRIPYGGNASSRFLRSTSNILARGEAAILCRRGERIVAVNAPMNKEESDRIHDLCSRIAEEHDHKKFLALVEELNRILSSRERSSESKKKGEERGS